MLKLAALSLGTLLAISAPALSWAQRLALSETVSATVPQSEMTARLFVERAGENLPELNHQVGRTLKQALSTARAGVTVASEGVYTQPVYDRQGRTNRYTVRAVVSVKGTEVESVAAVTEKLSQLMGFESVTFSVAPSQLKAIRDKLGEDAAKAFMERAQRVAKALGYKEARLVEGSLDGARPVMPTPITARPMAMAMSLEKSGVNLEQAAGVEQVSVTFSGTVELLR